MTEKFRPGEGDWVCGEPKWVWCIVIT